MLYKMADMLPVSKIQESSTDTNKPQSYSKKQRVTYMYVYLYFVWVLGTFVLLQQQADAPDKMNYRHGCHATSPRW